MGITKELKDNIKEISIIEEDLQNPYSIQLIEKNNPFHNKKLDYFYKDSNKRIKELAKSHLSAERNANYIFEFLNILRDVEQDPNISLEKLFDKSTSYKVTGSSSAHLFINATFGGTVKVIMYRYQSRILPWCCGICEYGNFGFSEFKKIESELVYNLIIDLIRLTASIERRSHSGAVGLINVGTPGDSYDPKLGVINYYIDTEFMKVLLKRDDLKLIKEFKNPKTSATLNMFLFDTEI